MAENEDFREVELTAERRGKPRKLLKACVSLGFPNHLERLMRNIQQELQGAIRELEDRIQLSLHSQLLGYFMSKNGIFWAPYYESFHNLILVRVQVETFGNARALDRVKPRY